MWLLLGPDACQENRAATERTGWGADRNQENDEKLYLVIIAGKNQSDLFCQYTTEYRRNQPPGQRPKCWVSPDGGDSKVHEYRSAAREMSTRFYLGLGMRKTYDRGPEYPTRPRRLQLRRATVCRPHHPWVYPIFHPAVFFSFPIEVGNRGNWQCSQSEEGEGWVEITVERCAEELNHPAGHRERGQVEPKPELCDRRKCGETPVSRQRLEVSIAIRSRFWRLRLQLSFEPADGLLETLTAL